MHKEELKDAVKDLFVNFTEGEYLRYFTSRFPRLLVHCYNAVENEAKHLLAEYFHDDASVQSLTAIGSPDITLEGSQLTINCADDITFPEKKVEIDRLVIKNISHLFIEQNKSFTNFLQTNSSNVIQLEFSYGSLKFESMNKILQKFPSLKEVRFNGGEYKASKTNQTIKQTTCNNLVKLEIWSAKNSNVLEAFLECQTMQKLTVDYPEVTLEKILQKCASLENLKVWVGNGYPVNDPHEANSRIHQLKVLTVKLWTKDERIQKRLISSILKQNNLQELYFNSIYSLSQSLRQQLAAHICQLERLTSLQILHEKLLEEVEAFAASFRVANTCLEEFGCELRYFKSLPSSFFAHFTNLRKLVIECNKAEETKVEDLISYMNKSQLTSIWLWLLPPTSFQLFQQLQVDALQVLEIHIKNKPQDKVPVFDILQELLPRHPNITRFEIRFANDYDEPKSLELIPMILETLKKLEWLEVENYPKITRDVLNQIVALETLTSWEINGHKSETFYKN